MLTIGQLAAHVGVTVRAVRHYHRIGLLPEPERDHSGYRSYGAAAVVRLIRIHVLADAGVPLTRVQELLDADAEEFAVGVGQIDEKLCADIMERLYARAHERGAMGRDIYDDRLVELMDTTLLEFVGPVAERLLGILEERGWTGWTRIERRMSR